MLAAPPMRLPCVRTLASTAACLATALCVAAGGASAPAQPRLPGELRATGLYEADGRTIRAGVTEFEPLYPLWSDGASKRRWIALPAGRAIDTTHPDAWEFPPGTRLWKEFRHGNALETRYIERLPDGTWRYATYVWNEEGTQAKLAPEEGIAALAARGAPGGRYAIPSRLDCLACHEGANVPVLGYSAVQLTPGLIAGATPTERAALGYLHGNCGHCHNAVALPALDLALAQESADPRASAQRTRASLLGRQSRFRPQGAAAPRRVVPGHAESSLLVWRMKSRDPLTRMPPLGVETADNRGLALIERWIDLDLSPSKEPTP
jgi:hypothetical protein